MHHTEIALHRPVTTVVVFVALALVGIISSRLLPLEKFPDIEFPGIFIQIPYEGSTPEEIERLITRPVEEALATLSGVEQMFSTSTENQAQVFLQFGWDQSMGSKGIEARAKVDGIRHELPADIRRIFIFTGSLADQPILQLRISSDRDLSDSYDMLDRLMKRRIERIEGVSKVELHGVDPREIRILLDSDRIAAHGVDLEQLRQLLERSNFAVSAGRITDGGQRFSVRPKGEFTSVEQIRDIVIDNANLRLRDVASVELRSPDREYGRHLDRSYAIGVQVSKSTGANMVEVADRVMEEVEKIGKLPQMQGINIFDLENQGDSVRKSLGDLLHAGIIGALLAIVVLYAFLRQLTTTLIITTAVPFSLTITLGALYFAGLSLNMLTMMGLMLAVGMLVDNAVVVMESISRHRAMKPTNTLEATMSGVREVGLAVTAGTDNHDYCFRADHVRHQDRHFGFHDARCGYHHCCPGGIAVHCPDTGADACGTRADVACSERGRMAATPDGAYARSLEWILQHPWRTALGILLTCVIGILPIPLKLVKFDAFPQESGRRLYMPYNIEGQHPLELVEKTVYQIEDFLFENQAEFDIRSVYSYYEKGRAESVILLTEEDDVTLSTKEIIKRIEEKLPVIAIGKPSFEFDQEGGGDGFSLQIAGDSTSRLNELAVDVVRTLSTVPGLKDVRSDAELGEREVRVVIDRTRADAVGLTAMQIAGSIAIAMRGQNLREFRGETGEVGVRLAFRENDKQSIEQLADLPLYTPDGSRITLGTVANFHIGHAAGYDSAYRPPDCSRPDCEPRGRLQPREGATRSRKDDERI